MRRLLTLSILSMLVVALTASVALGQSRGPSGADGSFNCEDFDTQPQAQAFFDADPSDPDGLDGPPGDAFTGEPGVACEGLPPGETEPVAEEPVAEEPVAEEPVAEEPVAPTAQYAENGSDGGMTALPDTGGFSLAGIAAGAGALLIMGGLLLKRRLN